MVFILIQVDSKFCTTKTKQIKLEQNEEILKNLHEQFDNKKFNIINYESKLTEVIN